MFDFFATAQSICGGSLQSVQLNGAHSSHSSCWPRRPARVQTLQDKAENLMARRDQRSMLSTTLWGKSPFEVAGSVIGRPKDTSSWGGSESECRVTVCVGVLRNSNYSASAQLRASTERVSRIPLKSGPRSFFRETPNGRTRLTHLVLLDRSPENHPTPSLHHTVWNFTSSMLMTVGDADTPWHHQVFRPSG